MPFVTAEDGVRIHYEVEGPADGIPLVLLHGLSGSTRRWREAGYVDALNSRFHLLLVDARGHGESDKPTTVDAYDWRTRVLDVVFTMRDAGFEGAHVWGYSMGSQTAMSAAIYAPQRFTSFTCGGASPFGMRTTDDRAILVPYEEYWEARRTRFGAHKEAWLAAFTASQGFAGAIAAFRSTLVPFLLYAGGNDTGPRNGIERFGGQRDFKHFIVDGADHLGAFASAAEVVPQVTAFIDEVEAASK